MPVYTLLPGVSMPSKTWLPFFTWRHLSSVSFYHNRVLVSMATIEMVTLGMAQRLQPSWKGQHRKVSDKWQIAAAELALSPGPNFGAEWMSIICPTGTKGIATLKYTHLWAVQSWMSPCIVLPPFQQLLRALINRVTSSAQTRQLFVKVGMCWSSVLLKGLRPSTQLENSYQAVVGCGIHHLFRGIAFGWTHEDSLEAGGPSIPEWVPTVPATWP